MNTIPLADRMRPHNLEDFAGQHHLVGDNAIIQKIIETKKVPSMILWGPPGTGKTTLARIIASHIDAEFIQLSATLSGVKDIRETVEQAKLRKIQLGSRDTILFIDEIHRFNKSQQDSLLPHVETGTVILIGATTENPSFEVNGALLSRTRVFTLQNLTEDDLKQIISRAWHDIENGLSNSENELGNQLVELIAKFGNGDARTALNILELSHDLSNGKKLTKEIIIEAAQQSQLKYDQSGEEHYNTISAFIKSMRAGDATATMYYLARMIEAGEDPKFIARRMVIFASEDVGLAQPTALVVANAVFRAVETVGYPECAINLAHGASYLANCNKDRSSYNALRMAQSDVQVLGNIAIPMSLRNAPTELMKELGYGDGYEQYPDKNASLLPKELENKKYFLES